MPQDLVAVRRNVTLWDRAVLTTNPLPEAQTRIFFNNPANNSRARTPGQTNMMQPGEVPARSMLRVYALGLIIEGRQPPGVEDPINSAAFRDLIRVLRGGTFEFFIGSSNDARLIIPLSEIAKTVEWSEVAQENIGGVGPALERGSIRIGKMDPQWGFLYPMKGDVMEIAALQQFSMLIEHDAVADIQGLSLINPILTGIVLADVVGSLAEQFGSFAN